MSLMPRGNFINATTWGTRLLSVPSNLTEEELVAVMTGVNMVESKEWWYDTWVTTNICTNRVMLTLIRKARLMRSCSWETLQSPRLMAAAMVFRRLHLDVKPL